jgi:hypothetical protein
MHCGCPLPGNTIGQKLMSKVLFGRTERPSLLPPANTNILQGTHPSDHNAVFAFHQEAQRESLRRSRREKASKRRQRDAEKVQKGQLDQRAYERGEGHDQAFLTAIPLYYSGRGVAGCVGFYGGVYGNNAGACAAGAGGCAAGGSACGEGGGCGSAGCWYPGTGTPYG